MAINIGKKSGFTIIEVMIAISVFSVGILTVLQLVTRNLATTDLVEQKTSATILAKEGIELVYNIRAANQKKGLKWNCIMNNKIYNQAQNDVKMDEICYDYFTGSIKNKDKVFQFSFDPGAYIYSSGSELTQSFVDNFESNRLYLYTGTMGDSIIKRYSNKKPEQEGNYSNTFARYIVFRNIEEGDSAASNKLPQDKILKVESHVLIQKGGYTGEIVLESFIGNY